MALTIGTRLGSHEITALLGKGGMGEVYRARDLRLKREVAIKILPEEFSRDADRVGRFQREAEVLASLNHPNIAAIYDLQEANGSRYLVLELVEGETLADRIARGPIPIGEALNSAVQICEALEAAHEKGIIHRDLKPANVKLTPDGKVKVLDFGLAKALESTPASATLSNSPTMLSGTMGGMIVGTAAYMSPEQAKGRPVDRRTDIFAFGCVLYEMLTGRPVFDGEDVPDILSRILQREPDWTLLPSDVPSRIRELLSLCLEKSVRRRRRDAGDVRVDIEESIAQSLLEPPANAREAQQRQLASRRRALVYVIGLLASVMLGAIAMRALLRPIPQPQPQLIRLAFVPPPAQALAIQGVDRDIAISPDGRQVVYRTGGTLGQLAVRSMDQLDGRILTGIGGARGPFISPDGRWAGFTTNSELRKAPMAGGPSVMVCRLTGVLRGASWGSDNTIIFATTDTSTGLQSVPAGGGEPKVLTKPDTAKGEANHLFPFILPGGRAVLFTVTPVRQRIENAQIAVVDLKTGQKKILIYGGSQAEYVETGHLVYAVSGTLRAVRFDLARLEVLSDPVPVEQVATSVAGTANFVISRNGTLLYLPAGPGGGGAQRSLVWVNRQGREEPLNAPPRNYLYPRISPDGTRVALDIRDQEEDIWIWDLMRQTLTRFTFDPGQDQYPVWSPDSRRLIFSSRRGGNANLNLYWQAADNTGTVERLTTSPNHTQFATSMSPDGKHVVFNEGGDIGMLNMDGKQTADPLIHTSFRQGNGEISPDGHWIAYESDESGQQQVYVRPFPNVDRGHWQISTTGGTRPLWARNGRELFYIDPSGALMAVTVQTGGQIFRAGSPAKAFEARIPLPSAGGGRTYDVSPDGQRFLFIKDNAGTEPGMVIVLNWIEELKQRVPVH